jgi:hypothetical protein
MLFGTSNMIGNVSLSDMMSGVTPDRSIDTMSGGGGMGANIASFLTEGRQIPQGSALKATQSQTVLPEWYTNYAMDLLANQQALAQRPFPLAPMPRVAEFSPMQQQAFGMAGQAAGAYQPALGQATQATQNLMGQSALGAASPYFSQATALNPSQVAAGDLGAARGLATQAGGANILGSASPFLQQAAGMSGVSAAQPFAQKAAGTIQQGMAPSGLQAAQPFLSQAGQTSAANIGQYMDPFLSQVVDRVGELGGRTLRERIMPEIEGRYIGAGQLGFGGRQPGSGTPSGMMTDTARAVRDVSADVSAQQGQLLSQGFGQAQAAAQADLARQAQLAGTAGQLGSQQQQALLDAARQQAGLGSQMGQLTAQQQQALAGIGGQFGQLTGAQQQGALGAAGQLAALGGLGAGLTQQQQQLLAGLGVNVGQLSGQDITRGLSGAQQLAGMGQQAQQLGLTGAGALQQVGGVQQSQAQRNLDVAYEDFLRQQNFPQEQIDAMLNTFRGVGQGVPTAAQEFGIVPTGQDARFQPSTAASIVGGLAGLTGVLGDLGVIPKKD